LDTLPSSLSTKHIATLRKPTDEMGNNDTQAIEAWSKQADQNAAAQRQSALQTQLQEETHPRRKFFHTLVVLVSCVTILSAVNMGVGQLVGMVFEEVGPVQYVMRVYVIALCLLAILVELEWTKFARESAIFRIWISRGLFYAFVGVLGLEENDTSSARNQEIAHSSASLKYVKAVAWIMVVCGAVYFFMGVLCLQLFYNRLRKDFQERRERAGHIRDTAERYMDQPAADAL
jgi:hypothetical protein